MRNRTRVMTWDGPKTVRKSNKRKNIWRKQGMTMFGRERFELNAASLKGLDEREVRMVDLPMVNMYEGDK